MRLTISIILGSIVLGYLAWVIWSVFHDPKPPSSAGEVPPPTTDDDEYW